MKHDTYFSAEKFWAIIQETLYIRDCIVYDYPRGLSLHYLGYIVDTRQLDVEDATIAACRWPYDIDTVCTSLDLSDRVRLYR